MEEQQGVWNGGTPNITASFLFFFLLDDGKVNGEEKKQMYSSHIDTLSSVSKQLIALEIIIWQG